MTTNHNDQSLAPVYQIRVQEPLDYTWADWFDGLSIAALPDGSTLLDGPVVDQAALNGLLNKIHHLNLTLLSVQRLEWIQAEPRDHQQEP